MEIKKEDKKDVPPSGNSPEAGKVEVKDTPTEDAEFEKELKDLENQDVPEKPVRTELEKATFTARSTIKRIKELGGDVSTLVADEDAPAEKPPVDTTQFVTRADFARAEAEKLAKSPGELKLIMWWVNNKGMTVTDAHYMANKGKISKIVDEVNRTRTTVPATPSGGAGERQQDKTDAPDLNEADKLKLTQSGMVYNKEKKAYVGKKVQYRFDDVSKKWVTEPI